MTIATGLAAVRAALDTIDGLTVFSSLPVKWEDADFPGVLVYLRSANLQPVGATGVKSVVVYSAELHVSRVVTPSAVAAAATWPEQVAQALVSASLSTLAPAGVSIDWPLLVNAAALAYGSTEEHYGLVFDISAKVMNT